MKKLCIFGALLASFVALSACGQKGPLYLPEAQAPLSAPMSAPHTASAPAPQP